MATKKKQFTFSFDEMNLRFRDPTDSFEEKKRDEKGKAIDLVYATRQVRDLVSAERTSEADTEDRRTHWRASQESDRDDDGVTIDSNSENEQDDSSQTNACVITQAMTGDIEDNGQLILARYASRSYLEYAMSVVKSRALPDVSDGQKPVQRRILIDMFRMGLKKGASAVKSARVVGDVLGKYHPHGDQSVYDAMVRMAQDFSFRYPLVDGEGNFGSRDGDSQAAMRYTEARLTGIAALLLDEVDSGAVDFEPNYDGNFTEPVVLPAKLPFVLLNGSSGIAVGMATDIPSHNLREVAQALRLILENPQTSLRDVLRVMPGPDFPCGGQIISSKATLRDIYATGRGKVTVRARYHFEELSRGQWQLVFDRLPPAASSASVLNQIEAITNPKLPKGKKTLSAKQQQAKSAMLAILDRARDRSGKDVPVRLVFEPKSSRQDRQEFVASLLAQTNLESNVSMNFVMLGLDGKPQQKNLMTILHEWIAFRTEAVRRRCAVRLEKVNDRLHVLEGRHLILLHLDEVIRIIRDSDDPKKDLMAAFPLTERQADDILEIRLRQLARLAAIAIEKEVAELEKERNQLERLLGSRAMLRRTIAREIQEAEKRFGDDRRTLIEEAQTMSTEVSVVDEPVTVIVTQKGFVRSRTGHGHDPAMMNVRMGDAIAHVLECRSVDSLSILSQTGRIYRIAVADIPGGRSDGKPLSAYMDVDSGVEMVSYFVAKPEDTILMATKNGLGFFCQGKDLSVRLRAGKQFIRPERDDRVLGAYIMRQAHPYVGLLSDANRLLLCDRNEIRVLSQGGKGVQLMSLASGEKLVAMTSLDQNGLVVHGIGRGKKAKDIMVGARSVNDYVFKRARRGKVLPITWQAKTLEAIIPNEQVAISSHEEELMDVQDTQPVLL